jgi:hypothetical protein
MSTIVTRAGKGSPLTHTEVDNNFTNLNTDKAEDSTVVKLTGDQTVGGTKTFSNTITGSISGNAGTVTNGVVTTGTYANPSWITSLDDGKVLPSMSGNSGKYLTTNGTDSSWGTVAVTPTSVSDQDNTSTGFFDLPSGTTAQRPASPNNGMARYNTTTTKFEFYQNGEWLNYVQSYNLEYLVVAGGGGGGGTFSSGGYVGGGGGGAGGYIAQSTTINSGASYPIVIGAGGAGGSSSGSPTNGSNGQDSTFLSLTAIGGGGGGNGGATVNGFSGGSGGGGSGYSGAGGSGTSGQGNTGGAGNGSPNFNAGGGGGAGAVGGNGTSTGGVGGAGLNWQSVGTFYAGGGGGGSYFSSGGTGGSGGGGNGGSTGSVGQNATANTGGGGGGAGTNSSGTNGNGGSGVVIIRYLGTQKGTGGTVTSSGGYTYHTFTSSGTFTA